MLATILRFLLLLFAIRVVFRFVSGLLGGYRGSVPERVAPANGTALVRDRVCNTFVPREGAVEAQLNGRTEYFCSTKCLTAALASPAADGLDGAGAGGASSFVQPHE